MIINDGTGGRYAAEVDSDNHLHTLATTQTLEHWLAHNFGEVYNIGFTVTPTGAGDCFFYIKNNDSRDMNIYTVVLAAASDEYLYSYVNQEGTPSGTTVVTPANVNAGSTNVADATAYYGVDITGMSGGTTVYSAFIKGGESSRIFPITSGVIVPQNKTFTAYVATGGIQMYIGVVINFHDEY